MNKNSNNLYSIKFNSNRNLTITSKTWNKETDDLFDFEANDITTREFRITKEDPSTTQFIVSQDDKLTIMKEFNEVKKIVLDKNSSKVLAEVISKNGQYHVYNPFISPKLQNFDKSFIDRLWLVLQKNELRGVEEGDIFKLGRVRLKIDKIVQKQNNYETNYQSLTVFNYLKTNTTQPLNLNNIQGQTGQVQISNNLVNQSSNNLISISNINLHNSFNNNEISNNNLNNDITIFQNKKSNNNDESHKTKEPQYQCKICFRGESDISDPLITPCKCSGSVGYIHYKCLKQCINAKINIKSSDNYICYIWKNFECEICLSEYPKIIKYKHHVYNLVDLEINYEQYILFDYTLYDDTKKKSFRKGIIVVKMIDDTEITIGRTQTNTIKLKDISVSRMHCYFIKKNNRIFIADKGSKFGTLIYLNKPFVLSSNIQKFKKTDKPFIDSFTNLISGKNFFNFRLSQNINVLSNFFSSTFCCRCKTTNDDEVILNFEEINDDDEITKIKDNLNDSYCDYVLNLQTIIKNEDVSKGDNSFI